MTTKEFLKIVYTVFGIFCLVYFIGKGYYTYLVFDMNGKTQVLFLNGTPVDYLIKGVFFLLPVIASSFILFVNQSRFRMYGALAMHFLIVFLFILFNEHSVYIRQEAYSNIAFFFNLITYSLVSFGFVVILMEYLFKRVELFILGACFLIILPFTYNSTVKKYLINHHCKSELVLKDGERICGKILTQRNGKSYTIVDNKLHILNDDYISLINICKCEKDVK